MILLRGTWEVRLWVGYESSFLRLFLAWYFFLYEKGLKLGFTFENP